MTNSSSREKLWAASSSVIAAIFLTVFKLTVGIATGSLGILSEAAHSGLDLMAAGMTFFAVRAADKPADSEHHYGHGKFENISALFETLLLLLTCFLIAREAISRLFFKHVVIDVTTWSFVVMFTSIAIDFTRARILSRTAKKYHSQALEADALHFSTDILSSSVVIFGLIGAKFGFSFADPISALGVSVIVVVISLRLGKRSIDVLVDRSPDKNLVEKIRQAALQSKNVEKLKSLRVRDSGGRVFVDMVVGLPRLLPFEQAHSLVDEIERRVRTVRDGIDVVVHAEPVATSNETVLDKVRLAASQTESKIHEIEVFSTEKGFVVDLHLEVEDAETIEAAHEKADELEGAIRSQLKGVDHIFIHIDKSTQTTVRAVSVNLPGSDLPEEVENYVRSVRGVISCSNLHFTESDSGLRAAMTCQFDETFSLAETVRIVNELEENITKEFPQIFRVVIHQEPVSHNSK
ncbi:MAG: cation-efflux pump [Bacteroidetes bacterium]|nr:cation-efflux pump [Bacteroidota bacterium]